MVHTFWNFYTVFVYDLILYRFTAIEGKWVKGLIFTCVYVVPT